MKSKIIAYITIFIGVFIIVFSKPIVFPILENTIGVERIVGKYNVIYSDGGEYYYTNPTAMMFWIIAIATIGLLIIILGIVILIKQKRK